MEEDEFVEQWWHSKPRLRRLFAPLLYVSSWQYRLWRFLQKPPEKRRKEAERRAKKITKRMDFPGVKPEDVVGGEENLNRAALCRRRRFSS